MVIKEVPESIIANFAFNSPYDFAPFPPYPIYINLSL